MSKDNNKEPKSFKIINKSKEGLVILLFGTKIEVTWEEFKDGYVMEKGRMSCHFNQKMQKNLEKADDLLTEGTIAAFAINSPRAAIDPGWKVVNLTTLGRVSDELHSLLGFSLEEVASLINQRVESLRKLNTKGEKPGRPKKNKVESGPKLEATTTLGDLPAMQELRKKYGL